MRRLRRFLPLKFKLWLRRIARQVVGIGAIDQSSMHLMLLDQKIEQSYSLINLRCDETRLAVEKLLEVNSQIMEQRIAQLERRIMTLESTSSSDSLPRRTFTEDEP